MSYKKQIAIVILNYNGLISLGPTLLYRCILSVLKSEYEDFIVIFVDNGSKDRSIEFIKKFFKDYIAKGLLDIIALPRNYGWSGGNNRGALYAIKKYDPDYLVFLNNDIFIEDPKWLRKIIEESATSGCELSSPLVYEFNLRKYVIGNILDRNGTSKPYVITDSTLRRLGIKGIKTIPAKYLHGAILVVSRKVFDLLKGFDENTENRLAP
ncbi:MAG: glycosyltransferase family 2 protein [Caldisphaera sp.]